MRHSCCLPPVTVSCDNIRLQLHLMMQCTLVVRLSSPDFQLAHYKPLCFALGDRVQLADRTIAYILDTSCVLLSYHTTVTTHSSPVMRFYQSSKAHSRCDTINTLPQSYTVGRRPSRTCHWSSRGHTGTLATLTRRSALPTIDDAGVTSQTSSRAIKHSRYQRLVVLLSTLTLSATATG